MKQQVNMTDNHEIDDDNLHELQDVDQGDISSIPKESTIFVNTAMSGKAPPAAQGDIWKILA